MEKINRREFVKLLNRGLAFTGLAAITGPIVSYFFPAKLEEMPSEPVLVGKADELSENESKVVRFGRYPALIIHTSQGLKAYSAVCTHFACIVKYDPESKKIACPCHEGYFDPESGEVIAGPPPTGLTQLNVQIIDSEIYVGGEA